jgi:sugar phosphate isomerase/epimerase
MHRRRFLATAAALTAAPALAAGRSRPGPICFFSKHLPKLSPKEMAHRLRGAGYGGIELTVRPGGHVAPEKVAAELPKAVADIRAEGLEVPILATAFTSADDRTAEPILAAAAKLGIPLVRPGWYSYGAGDVRQELKRAAQQLAGLTALAARHQVALAYQNHVGNLGAAVWDLDALMAGLDPRWAGVYFDIRHAIAEGTGGSWKTALSLVAARVKVFSVKDFHWKRGAQGEPTAVDCPMGEGLVDTRTPLAVLARAGFRGPITVFNEYEPGSEDKVVAAAARDLKYLQARIAEAYS